MAKRPARRRSRASGGEPPSRPEAAPFEGRDVVLLGQKTESGDGYQVLRRRDDRIEVGQLQATREAQPIHGELVKLHSRPEHERLFDVEVVLDTRAEKPTDVAAPAARSGPAQVATDAYRDRWDAIFGGKRRSPALN